MLAQKNYTSTAMQTVAHEPFPTHFRLRLPRFPRWIAYLRKENHQPLVAVDFAIGNERFAENGYYQVSADQAIQEKTINKETLNMLQPLIR